MDPGVLRCLGLAQVRHTDAPLDQPELEVGVDPMELEVPVSLAVREESFDVDDRRAQELFAIFEGALERMESSDQGLLLLDGLAQRLAVALGRALGGRDLLLGRAELLLRIPHLVASIRA